MLDSLTFHPQRMMIGDCLGDGTVIDVGSRQNPDAHQKLVDDLSTGKAESLFEELGPFCQRFGMVMLKPSIK